MRSGEIGHTVTIMTRHGCHNCDEAIAEAGRICAELNVALTTTDVDSDPGFRAEYGDRVPVILVDDVEHGFWRVEADRLRAALAT